ncbi:hypothetical protein CF65_01590 [Aggregatibacter actinomycetemcomitans HK1651]|nr:hypothetical protein CF65_01590 [Aggregatibacter actinomycetemcomitans HK1651]
MYWLNLSIMLFVSLKSSKELYRTLAGLCSGFELMYGYSGHLE